MAYELEEVRISQEIFYYLLEHHELQGDAEDVCFCSAVVSGTGSGKGGGSSVVTVDVSGVSSANGTVAVHAAMSVVSGKLSGTVPSSKSSFFMVSNVIKGYVVSFWGSLEMALSTLSTAKLHSRSRHFCAKSNIPPCVWPSVGRNKKQAPKWRL